MASLTLRLVKNAPLTNVEMDANLTNLNTAKLEKDGTDAMTGRLVLVATSLSHANVRLTPSATDITPTTTVAGDLWNNQGVIKFKTGYLGSGTGIASLVTTADTGTVTNAMLAGSIQNSKLISNTITVTAGTGLSGGGIVALGGTVTLNNDGIVDVTAGTGIGVTGTTTKAITNTGVTSLAAGGGITVSAGAGAITVTNSDRGSSQNIFKNILVTGQSTISADQNSDDLTFAAGLGITITTDAGTDTVTVTNAGVRTLAGTANQVTASASTGAVTLSLPQSISTGSNVQFGGIGIGVSPAAGEVRASGEVTAYSSSDMRLKENILPITDAIAKVKMITGVEFDWREDVMIQRGGIDGYFVRRHDIGVIAQEVEKTFPEVVGTREDGFKAVRYEKLVAVLIEAVKDLQKQIDELKGH